MKDSRIKAGIKMASEYGGRDIKPATDLTLSQTMYILRQVVSKASPFIVVSGGEGSGWDGREMHKKGRNQRCDQSCRGAKTRLVHFR
jgi:hypothetical protein